MSCIRLALTALLAALILKPAATPQEAREEAQEETLRQGRLLYRMHCQSCHGEGGAGGGFMAQVLRIEPTDLTTLAREAGGSFPRDEAWAAIDGRAEVRGHGTREMPVWGLSFQERGRDTDQEAEVRDRIRALVAFIRSVQKD